MNTSPSPRHESHRGSSTTSGHDPLEADKASELNLGELFANLWEGRYLIAGSIAFFLAFGVLYILRATPIYQVEALLQTETRKGEPGSGNGRVEGLFTGPTVATGEIEILRSNLVLGRTVEALGLDINADPILPPVIGKFLARSKSGAPRVEVEALDIPDHLRGTPFTLELLPGGSYRWQGPGDTLIATGKVGEPIAGSLGGEPLKLKVRYMMGKPGQKFSLVRKAQLDAINALRLILRVEERGKDATVSSNLLGLSLEVPEPNKGAAILNEILNQYIRQSLEKNAGDSAQTLKLLEEQRPVLQAGLAEAENRLNQFRSRMGSVDPALEGSVYLQQSSSLSSQITALKQKKADLLRTYNENADVVTTVNEQIEKLQAEANQVSGRLRSIPHTQQEVVRLSREVQVKTELYTALLNNIQRLQNTLAGEMGNARIVDRAIPSSLPVAPKKKMLMVLFLFLGTVVGAGLTALMRIFRRGIEDHRIIEAKLGLPVLVTIPHSDAQEGLARAIQNRSDGTHVLTTAQADDLAAESLRSLRTMLHFAMKDSTNRVIMVSGPSVGIGKSFVSANLASILALNRSRVLVVDGDLRRGNLHHYFGRKNRIGGLSEVLSGRQAWQSVVQPVLRDASGDSTEVFGLHFMSTGILPPDPSELLMTNRFKQFISEVSAEYDFIIIDAPPLLPVTDAVIISASVGQVLLVAKYGQHSLDELRACQKLLENLGVSILGCVFNDVTPIGLSSQYRYYKYAYHYKYH